MFTSMSCENRRESSNMFSHYLRSFRKTIYCIHTDCTAVKARRIALVCLLRFSWKNKAVLQKFSEFYLKLFVTEEYFDLSTVNVSKKTISGFELERERMRREQPEHRQKEVGKNILSIFKKLQPPLDIISAEYYFTLPVISFNYTDMQDHLIRTNNTWPVRQIEFYDSKNSHKFTSKSGEALRIRDVGNSLILHAEETILGTIPIGPGSNVTAFYTGDCMSFNESQNNIEKTVKIQFSCSQKDLRNFVSRIQQCIRVSRTEEHEISKNHKIAELLKNNPMDAIKDVNTMLPTNYPLEAAVKLCLADPKFPGLVENVSQALKRLAQSGTETGYEV